MWDDGVTIGAPSLRGEWKNVRMADSDSEDDTYVTIGTALPTYGDDEVPKKATPYHEQSVQDARGRPQRLHGAFTGGFSAGYFNSVGSKEGWQPATFRSSRSDRANETSQKPEDFMDDEDLGEHGIAPRQVKTTLGFTSEKKQRDSLKRQLPGGSGGIIPADDILNEIIVPTSIPVGVKLLCKMGWKEGQGVGPKAKKKHKKKTVSGQKVYGCALPDAGGESEESEDEIAASFTFAPKDTNPVNFNAKDNRHGLGYSGIHSRSVLGSSSFSLFQESPAISKTGKKGIKGHAFGVGALEDEDDDIYASDHKSNYFKELGGPEHDNNHGWTAPKYRGADSSKLAIGYVCSVLQGFSLSSKPLKPKRVYAPPTLPRDFRPVHQPISMFRVDGVNQNEPVPSKPPDRRIMDPSVRAALIGEAPEIRSVFDLVSKEDKDKMTAAKQLPQSVVMLETLDKPQAPAAPSLTTNIEAPVISYTPPAPPSPSLSKNPPGIQEQKAPAMPLFKGASGFKPFAKNPAKQVRYDHYLEAVKHGKNYIPSDNMTEWEQNHEREEFARSAQLYRPMSSLMAARFTQAKYDDDTDKVEEPAGEQGELSDQQKAAEMKMFGKLTRDYAEWHPDKLLCKRFNIPNPFPESSLVGVPKVKREKFSVFNFLTIPADPELPSPPPPTQGHHNKEETPKAIEYNEESLNVTKPIQLFADIDKMQSKPLAKADEGNLSEREPNLTGTSPSNDKEKDTNESDEPERPPMDLFRAIFADSDSDQSSPDSESEEEEKQKGTKPASVSVAMESSVSAATDDISKKTNEGIINTGMEVSEKRNVEENHGIPVASMEERLNPAVSQEVEEYYGPKLPPQMPTRVSVSTEQVLQAPPGKRDDHRKKKHKHKDKRDRHKHKRKKSKHKKVKKKHKKDSKKSKKQRRHEESSSDSEVESDSNASSSSEVSLPTNLDLLQRLKSLPSNKRPRE